MLKTLTTAPCGARVTSCVRTVPAPIAVAVGRVTSWSSTDTAEPISQVSIASFPTLCATLTHMVSVKPFDKLEKRVSD